MRDDNKQANALINATSPYLLQHAYNPVKWQEWNEVSLGEAKQSDKPILVSIGYSSCHWCHVMERECFEKDDIARVMNDHFVCIKIDREERPDIDQIYMEAVQAMGGHGGWPLNVFLTPDQKPFYGGTYFPPAQWVKLLRQISATFTERRKELEENAAHLTDHISVSDLSRFLSETSAEGRDLAPMFATLKDRFDWEWGGMDKAPKFVMPSIWRFLLRWHAMSGNPEALQIVELTLKKMQQGGLYDQLGGGFSRYSVDGQWFAPHFEKMLYDNAQLLTLYSEAYTWTHDPSFKKVVHETVGWLKREMTAPGGGFYSALDADSEGVEGKFYCWTWDELEAALGEETETVAAHFHCSRQGNWEHGLNILMETSLAGLPDHIIDAKAKMLKVRSTRVRPGLDDKILLGWNAMTITGLVSAYKAFNESDFLLMAETCISFLEANRSCDNYMIRSFKDKQSATEGFLEDYAFLIEAYIGLYQVTFNESYIHKASHWSRYVIANFSDASDNYFHFTGDRAEKLIARKKEIFDNVIPGSNSVMATNLFHLGVLLDDEEFRSLAAKMTQPLTDIIIKEPGYMSNWGILLASQQHGLAEVVIVGPDAENKRSTLSMAALPFAVFAGTKSQSDLPLLEGRVSDGNTLIYVCYNKACQLPVEREADALQQIQSHR